MLEKIKTLLARIIGLNYLSKSEIKKRVAEEIRDNLTIVMGEEETDTDTDIEFDDKGDAIPVEKETDEDKEEAVIQVSVDIHGEVKLRPMWNSGSAELAQNYGRLIAGLMNGHLEEETVKLFVNIARQRPETQDFIDNMLEAWKTSVAINEPVMKPSEVLQQGKQFMEHRSNQ